jgi:tungstate transport system ATP-binding protein
MTRRDGRRPVAAEREDAADSRETDVPRLALEGVAHGFGDGPVLEDVSLELEAGTVTTVIGPSGTGKTTLLRLAALFEPPDAGAVRHGGDDAWALSGAERLRRRRRVGMAFQSPSLFDASVARNVEYGLRVRRPWRERLRSWLASLRGSDPPERVREALATVGLEGNLHRDGRSLSGGEAQRVAFARAVAYDPEVLVLDEPTSDLDPRNTAILEGAVAAAGERGIAILLATHDMHQARRVSDRVAVLLDGEVVEAGPGERVFEAPRDERTRRFVDGDLLYDRDELSAGE